MPVSPRYRAQRNVTVPMQVSQTARQQGAPAPMRRKIERENAHSHHPAHSSLSQVCGSIQDQEHRIPRKATHPIRRAFAAHP
jgi:hypothetical protein